MRHDIMFVLMIFGILSNHFFVRQKEYGISKSYLEIYLISKYYFRLSGNAFALYEKYVFSKECEK